MNRYRVSMAAATVSPEAKRLYSRKKKVNEGNVVHSRTKQRKKRGGETLEATRKLASFLSMRRRENAFPQLTSFPFMIVRKVACLFRK